MKSFTFAAITALLSLTTAAPTPAASEKRWPSGSNIITPTYTSLYNIKTGGLTYNPAYPKAYFDEYSTISTFTVPSGIKGKKCSLHFYLDPTDSSAYVKNGGVQVFSSLNIPPKWDVAKWGPPGNQRNQHYGNLKVVKGGDATVDDWPRLLENFPCEAQGTYAYEVVAKWDVGIDWSASKSGLYLKYQ